MRILLVKTSSLGDLIHNLPVATDIAQALPFAQIDWCVESVFSDIPGLHPAVQHVLPVHVRRWRKFLGRGETWRAMHRFRRLLQQVRYDAILDTQGLIKSAVLTRLAHGPCWGYDRASAREALASLAYQHTVSVPRDLHAVTRNRQLAARALGYSIAEKAPNYGICPPAFSASWLPTTAYAALLTATSRDDKCWPESHWRTIIEVLARRGIQAVLPSGSSAERTRAERIAYETKAVVAPSLRITELAGVLAQAAVTIGVDTGLTHLSAAVGTPTIALYVASDPGLTGVIGPGFYRNLGTRGATPSAAEVTKALEEALA